MKKELNEKAKIGSELDFASNESFNLLKTNILFSLENKDKGYVIGITSASPEEGKSYNSINLAYSLAIDGKKVLLINGDMRKPSIEKTLDLNQEKGLSNALVGCSEDLIVKNVLTDNLDFLASGAIPPNPAKLIQSEAMNDLLKKMSEEYNYIVLDLPPVNSVVDAIGVSNYIDGMVLVVKHGSTRRKDLKEAIRKLKFANANILGFVYNGYNVSGSRYNKYNYYKNKK